MATVTAPTWAQVPDSGVAIPAGGYVTGQAFRELDEAQQEFYVMGLVDGMVMAPVFGGGNESTQGAQRLLDCLKEMSSTQMAAIARKHLEKYPERWHHMMRFLFWQALIPVCPTIRGGSLRMPNPR